MARPVRQMRGAIPSRMSVYFQPQIIEKAKPRKKPADA